MRMNGDGGGGVSNGNEIAVLVFKLGVKTQLRTQVWISLQSGWLVCH